MPTRISAMIDLDEVNDEVSTQIALAEVAKKGASALEDTEDNRLLMAKAQQASIEAMVTCKFMKKHFPQDSRFFDNFKTARELSHWFRASMRVTWAHPALNVATKGEMEESRPRKFPPSLIMKILEAVENPPEAPTKTAAYEKIADKLGVSLSAVFRYAQKHQESRGVQ